MCINFLKSFTWFNHYNEDWGENNAVVWLGASLICVLRFSRCKILSNEQHNIKAMCASVFVLVTIETATIIAAPVFIRGNIVIGCEGINVVLMLWWNHSTPDAFFWSSQLETRLKSKDRIGRVIVKTRDKFNEILGSVPKTYMNVCKMSCGMGAGQGPQLRLHRPARWLFKRLITSYFSMRETNALLLLIHWMLQ